MVCLTISQNNKISCIRVLQKNCGSGYQNYLEIILKICTFLLASIKACKISRMLSSFDNYFYQYISIILYLNYVLLSFQVSITIMALWKIRNFLIQWFWVETSDSMLLQDLLFFKAIRYSSCFIRHSPDINSGCTVLVIF